MILQLAHGNHLSVAALGAITVLRPVCGKTKLATCPGLRSTPIRQVSFENEVV